MSYPIVYDYAGSSCSGGPRPGAQALQAYLLQRVEAMPDVVAVNSGIYNCRLIDGTNARSTHSEGRAGDTGIRPNGRWPTAPCSPVQALVEELVSHAHDLGVQQVIYARRYWRNTFGRWFPYNGISPHYDHIHWELTNEASNGLTMDQVLAVFNNEGEPEMGFMSDLYAAYTIGGVASSRPDRCPSVKEVGDWWALLKDADEAERMRNFLWCADHISQGY